MDAHRFDRTVWTALAVLVLAILALAGLDALVGVRAAAITPPDGATAGPFARIGVTFNRAMDAPSAEAAFYIDPPAAGAFAWEGRRLWFTPAAPLAPGGKYTLTVAAGARASDGSRLQRDVSWDFSVRAPWVVYLVLDGAGRELWARPLDGGDPLQLTQVGGSGVYDYAVARDGDRIAYSAGNALGGLDVWLVGRGGEGARKLIDCGAEACASPAWSPDGARLAYSRGRPARAGQASLDARLWTVAVATGQSAPLYQDETIRGLAPLWSPDGARIAAYDGGAHAVRILDLHDGQQYVLDTPVAESGAWSADGNRFYYAGGEYFGDQAAVSIYQLDFATGAVTPFLMGEGERLEPAVPAWAPGDALGAVAYRPGNLIANRQIWLVGRDGSSIQEVAGDAGYNYAAYRWDPWGSALAFQRFQMGGSASRPDVLVWERATGATRVLAEGAALPAWLP